MLNIIWTLVPILLAVFGGWLLGKFLPSQPKKSFLKLLYPIMLVLLISIGYEFGNELNSVAALGSLLWTALIFSFCISATTWLLIAIFETRATQSSTTVDSKHLVRYLIKVVVECGVVILMLVFGMLLFFSLVGSNLPVGYLFNSYTWLLIMLVIVGMDLSSLSLGLNFFNRSLLLFPLMVIFTAWLGGLLAGVFTGTDWLLALTMSSGLGWYSLTGTTVAKFYGHTHGAIALFIDIFREVFAILLIYLSGAKKPLASIATGGATTLDTTLPMIKYSCPAQFVPIALFNGLILTLVVPLLLGALLSLA